MDGVMRVAAERRCGAALASVVLAAMGVVLPVCSSMGPARAAEAPAPVVLDQLSFRRGRLTVEIPHVEARGTSLTGQELRDILDPSSPLALVQRLTRLSADAIAAPEVTFRTDPKPGEAAGQSVTLHDVSISDVRAGKAASLSIRSVDGTLRSGASETDALTIGAIVAHAVDPQLALTIATGSRSDRQWPVSPVYGDISAVDLKVRTDGAQVLSVDRIESGAFEGRPLLDTPADLLRSLEGSPGPMPPGDRDQFYGVLLDAAASFKLDRFRVSGVSFTDDGSSKSAVRIGTMLLGGLEPSRLAMLEIDDAALDAGDIHMTMKSAGLSNTGSNALLGTALARLMGRPPVSTAVPKPDATGGVEFKVSDFHLAFPTTDADSPFPPGTVNVVDLPTVQSGESASQGGSVVETHAHVGVRYDIPPGGTDATIQKFRDMGLSHLDVTFGYRVMFDATARELRLDDLAFDGKDIGSVAVSAGLADLPETLLQPGLTSDEMTARLARATFRDFTLTVVDRGFLGRAMPVLAREAGTSPAMMRAGLKTKVDLDLPGLLGPTPTEAAVARAIDRFIDDAGTLVLSVRAPNGLVLGTVDTDADPKTIARRLDITAETHR